MANVIVYRTYPMGKTERDPILDEVEDVIKKENLTKRPGILREISGVSTSTLHNWLSGKTKSPRYATVMAVFHSLGYEAAMDRRRDFDLDAERTEAKRWKARQDALAAAAKRRKIEARKTAREHRTSV